jgi:hypothetical protein
MEMRKGMTASVVANEQMRWTKLWHGGEVRMDCEDDLLRLVQQNHGFNFRIWHEEDKACRDDLGAEAVRDSKRAIDRFNQQRNDFVERMDKLLVEALRPREEGCPFNSETPGMIVDRLSIFALKEYHMQAQSDRIDASAEHRAACMRKLAVIHRQRADLTAALDQMIADVRAGERSFRVYIQFNMSNDPTMNPQLYSGRKE